MTGTLQPLDQNFAVVDPKTGYPTLYFIQWAQQRQIDISEGISAAQALTIVQDFLADHPLIAGSGITLAPSGNIASDVTISAEVQAILDQISTTQGTVLFRGAADWQALAPGAAGQFLKTGGAGADPSWATAGGGFPYAAVHLTGSTTPAYYDASANVSGVTRNGVGKWRISFTTAFPTTNYTLVGSGQISAFANSDFIVTGLDRNGTKDVAFCDIVVSSRLADLPVDFENTVLFQYPF